MFLAVSGCLWQRGDSVAVACRGGLKLTSFLRRACARWRYGGGATDMGIWGWWNDALAAITRGGYKLRACVGRRPGQSRGEEMVDC